MKRNPVLLIFIFFLPGILMILTCISVGIDPVNLPVGILNHESNCTNASLARCEADSLSCYFIDSLTATVTVHLVTYQDDDIMMADAATGSLRGHLTIPPDFSHSLLKRLLKPDLYDEFVYFYGINDSLPVGTNEKMALSIDTSNTLVAMVLREAMADSIKTVSKLVTEVCEGDLGGTVIDLAVVEEKTPSLGREGSSYQEYIVPAFLTLTLYFLAMSLTSESFISERSQVRRHS